MNISKLSMNDRLALGAGAVVVVTALLSISNEWGALMVLSLAGGLGAIGVVLQPQLAPAGKLPASKGICLLALGGMATIATGLTALDWLGWIIDHPVRFDTIQFMTGFAAAVVLFVAGVLANQGARGALVPPTA